jgi:lysophospholipase L1-like esterase
MPTAFPGGLTPVLQFDASQAAYQDLAQAVPATAPYDPVRSIPQPSPLSGSWTAPSDAERPGRYAADTLGFEPLALDYPSHVGQYLIAPAGALASIAKNNATIAISFRPLCTYDGPGNALLWGDSTGWGLDLTGHGVGLRYDGAYWDSGLRIGNTGGSIDGDNGCGDLVCLVARFNGSAIDMTIDDNGTVTSASFTTASPIVAGAPNALYLGNRGGGGFGNVLVSQCAVLPAVNNTDRDRLIAWLKTNSVSPAFPASKKLITVLGDSIAAGVFVARPQSWAYRMLASIRPTFPDVQQTVVAIGGSSVAFTSGAFSSQYVTAVNRASLSRTRQVAVVTWGSNDCLANRVGTALDTDIARLWPLCDGLRAAGYRVALANAPPRRGLMGGVTNGEYDASRAAWNAALDAQWAAHADALIDLRAVAGMGADNDASNAANYGDGVHPTAAGHALNEPAYRAAVTALLADAPPTAPVSAITVYPGDHKIPRRHLRL